VRVISRKFEDGLENIPGRYGAMKHFLTTTKHLRSNAIEWALFKVPQLFVIIYGK